MISRLKEIGLIGLNERNIDLVSRLNPRRLHRRVNDKIETKRLAAAANIPTPELYGTISNTLELRRSGDLIGGLGDFVIKPAMGTQGNGIMVVGDEVNGGRLLANGRRVTVGDLRYHINNIISGMYSMAGQPDKAVLEERVIFNEAFDDISFKGVPDIRVIVVKGIPVAAMLRLPTSASDGKANLHKGGVGVGIDIASGRTGGAMQYDRPISCHPDTGASVTGRYIPDWGTVLEIAARAYEVTELGYLGVDVVLDQRHGPMLLELNARPGISIQIANGTGLRHVVKAALAESETRKTIQERLAFTSSIAEPIAN